MLGTSKKFGSLLVAAMVTAFAGAMAAGGRPIGDDAPKPSGHRRAQRMGRGARGHRKHHTTTFHKPNGERECARRRAQIAVGTLKVTG